MCDDPAVDGGPARRVHPGAARTEVIAHRGASENEPEHTLAAYRRAIDVGADVLECDVRLTADGHLVCVHDRKVNRTSTGRGLVSTFELAQLEGLDWGSWKRLPLDQGGPGSAEGIGGHSSELPERVDDSDRSELLTLRRLLTEVRDADRPIRLAVETKHPTRYGALVERRLVDLLDEFGWAFPPPGVQPPVRMMSFSMLAIRRMRLIAPAIPLVLLMERVPVPFREGALPRSVVAAGVRIDTVRSHPKYVHKVHAQGRAVHVWTVDDLADVDRCVHLGVEAIITNRPEAVLAHLANLGRR